MVRDVADLLQKDVTPREAPCAVCAGELIVIAPGHDRLQRNGGRRLKDDKRGAGGCCLCAVVAGQNVALSLDRVEGPQALERLGDPDALRSIAVIRREPKNGQARNSSSSRRMIRSSSVPAPGAGR